MKKIFLPLVILAVAIACNKPQNNAAKRSQLDSLKKMYTDIGQQIAELEKDPALIDSTIENKSKTVAITQMMPATFRHYIEVQAKVEGDEDVMLSAESMGNITAVLVHPGDQVTVGQVLATIDDKLVRQNIAELQSQLDLARQVYLKQQNLWNQKIGSEMQYLQAKANKESLEKKMEFAKEQLQMTKIKSPIDGTVDDVIIKIGQAVTNGMPCIRVVNLRSLKVKGEVAEAYVNRVSKGDQVVVYFPDAGKEISGKLDYSGSRIDPVNRTFNVELLITQKNIELHPNMVAVLKIVDYAAENTFTLPVGAVQSSPEGEYVFVVDTEKGKLISKRKVVKTGLSYNGITEVKDGLTEGDKVITTGYQNLVEGDRISLME